MTRDDFRRRADAVRWIPLEIVLAHWGGQRDPHDKHRWHTELGPLSITGAKFFNWHLHQGGGGAIDLVMHLGDMDASAAIEWLEQHLGSPAILPSIATRPPASARSSSCRDRLNASSDLRLPPTNTAYLDRVRRYLNDRRSLEPRILQPLIDAGKVYPDHRGNAVFLMVAGKANRPIGAELRGTGQQAWHGLAPGTSRDAGYFWVGTQGSQDIVLCESAIDAISCFQWHSAQLTTCICLSTAGARSNPPWLSPLLTRDYHIHCGFDNDDTGNAASHRMIALHPSIQRLPPPAHDWNDALRS